MAGLVYKNEMVVRACIAWKEQNQPPALLYHKRLHLIMLWLIIELSTKKEGTNGATRQQRTSGARQKD